MRGAQLIEGILAGDGIARNIDWKDYKVPGREGVEIYPFYTTEDTGSDGPAAALVRYQPGAEVKTHRHPGYELIYVLDGVLSNDEGDHSPGTLQICPPGSEHALGSKDGCTFLVVWEKPVELIA
jgi:anti-sigma factor ChrR (cupin superfamily)